MGKSKTIFILAIIIFILSACVSNVPDENLEQVEARGKNLFAQYCAACHDFQGDAIIVGPSLSQIATIAETRVSGKDAKTYIEESFLYPDVFIVEGFDDLMPATFSNLLAQEEIDSLMAYLLTLK